MELYLAFLLPLLNLLQGHFIFRFNQYSPNDKKYKVSGFRKTRDLILHLTERYDFRKPMILPISPIFLFIPFFHLQPFIPGQEALFHVAFHFKEHFVRNAEGKDVLFHVFAGGNVCKTDDSLRVIRPPFIERDDAYAMTAGAPRNDNIVAAVPGVVGQYHQG